MAEQSQTLGEVGIYLVLSQPDLLLPHDFGQLLEPLCSHGAGSCTGEALQDRLGEPGNSQQEKQEGKAFREVNPEQGTAAPNVVFFSRYKSCFSSFSSPIRQKRHHPL